MKYDLGSNIHAIAKRKVSSSSAHRSAASAIVGLCVGLEIIRFGILQFSSAAKHEDFPPIVVETGQVLVPFGSGSSVDIAKIAGADELMAEHDEVEGATAWGRDGPQIKDIPGALQADIEHTKRMLELEFRKAARQQSRLEKQKFATATEAGFVKFFQARRMLQAQRRKERTRARELPGASQTYGEHEQRLQEVEARKVARQQFWLEKHASADETAYSSPSLKDIPGALQAEIEHTKRIVELESRKVARQQGRLEKRKFAQATEDGFAKFFQVRKKIQEQRRKERTWARGLPGSSQAYGEHEQRMQEVEARKLTRQQHRSEMHLYAQAIESEFTYFFQERKISQASMRESRKWAHNLPGENQAYADHEQMIHELQARKEARQQHRLEKQILGQETKDGFEKFFQARRDAYAQLRRKHPFASSTRTGFA
mmetsp:Transcript_116323/g.181772  ORF Transcript_116323/g.181772 Transcript_116323/m.181772 type:complete len:428 (-) Transcript_116323:53-1336(-)